MLEKLSKEQEALIPAIRDKWINQFHNLGEINIEKLEKGVKWIYEFSKLEAPRIIICNSILEAQLTIHCLKQLDKDNVGDNVRDNVGDNVWANVWANVGANVGDNVGANVGDNVRANVRDNVRANVRDNVWDNVWANVRDNVWANVWDNVWANVWANVGDNVWANVWDNVGDNVVFESLCSYGDVGDFSWVAQFDYFSTIGVLKHDGFNAFKDLLSANYYTMIQMSNYCFVVKPPKHVKLDSENRLNSIDGYAFEFKDGTGMNFVNGMYISDEKFKQLSNEEIKFEDFIKEENEELKSAILAYYQQKFGDEYVFKFLSKHLFEIDTYVDKKDKKFLENTTKGMNVGVYTLFKGEINGTDIAYVRCFCPSTDRMFYLGVDPLNNSAKDAIASLYRIPRVLKDEIIEITRQGERFCTNFSKNGESKLDSISKEETEDLVSITGNEYFKLITYEY